MSENKDIIKRQIFKMNEFNQIYEDIIKNIDENIVVPKDVLDSFKIKDRLNKDIWDAKNIKPEIGQKLIRIAKSFISDISLPQNIKIKDVLFVGSLANYNWSKFSDFDLHIVIDFSEFEEDKDFVKSFFDAQKNIWNENHDITILGYPVEIYVQDKDHEMTSSAIYSLLNDRWLAKPEKKSFKLDKPLVIGKIKNFFGKLKVIEEFFKAGEYEKVIEKIKKIKDRIKTMRKSGLESGGEFSTENIIFKILRRTDFIEIINNYKNKAYDELMSINEDIP